MLKVNVYKASYAKTYIRGLEELEKRKLLKLNITSSQVLYDFLSYLNNKSKLFRKLTRKPVFKSVPSLKEIIKSFFAPLTLLFSRKPIILGFSPYSNMINYMWILKLLNKKITYFNSWPYWDGSSYVRKPILLGRKCWESFFKNTQAVCVSKKGANAFKKFGADSHWIPHPVDTSIFKPAKKSKSKKTKVLFVGRLVKEKGILDILEISKNFKNTEFLFAGDGELTPQIKALEKTHPVKHLGFVKHGKDLAELFNSSDILVLNSYKTKHWEELFGIVVVEAMACSLPVIASDCIGPKEILQNTKAGILIPQKNKKELEKALRKLINNPNLRKKMGEEGRKLAIEQYDIKKVADSWLTILK